MKLETITLEKPFSIEKPILIVVPPLPKEIIKRLPKYCPKPNPNNLATQYYFWNLEIQKENRKLQNEVQKLKEENQNLKGKIEDLKKKIEDLITEKQNFLKMLFKPKRQKRNNSLSFNKSSIKRTKQSYYRPLPDKIDEEKQAILKCCPHCQSKLSKKVDQYQRIIEDIPKIEETKVKVIRYTINRYYCRKCKKIVSAKPLEVLPKCRLGINTLLLFTQNIV